MPVNNEFILRILHERKVGIKKSVPRATVWHQEAPPCVMLNCDPRDFVDQYIILMMDSFS